MFFDVKAEAILRFRYALLKFLQGLVLMKRGVKRLGSIFEECQLCSYVGRINRNTSGRADLIGME